MCIFTSEQQALPNQSVSQRVSALNTETNIRQHETKKQQPMHDLGFKIYNRLKYS